MNHCQLLLQNLSYSLRFKKNTVSSCEKLSKLRAGGEIIWAMPKRKGARFVMSFLSSHSIISYTNDYNGGNWAKMRFGCNF